MRSFSKVSLILGGVTVVLGYAMVVINIISLRKGKKISKVVE